MRILAIRMNSRFVSWNLFRESERDKTERHSLSSKTAKDKSSVYNKHIELEVRFNNIHIKFLLQ